MYDVSCFGTLLQFLFHYFTLKKKNEISVYFSPKDPQYFKAPQKVNMIIDPPYSGGGNNPPPPSSGCNCIVGVPCTCGDQVKIETCSFALVLSSNTHFIDMGPYIVGWFDVDLHRSTYMPHKRLPFLFLKFIWVMFKLQFPVTFKHTLDKIVVFNLFRRKGKLTF